MESTRVILKGVVEKQQDRELLILAMGNTVGIEKVEDFLEVEKKGRFSNFHQVIQGETLMTIAQLYYDDYTRFTGILTANHPLLKKPSDAYPGMVIRVPLS